MSVRERNIGIDALRVLCMLAVVIYHLLGHGWIMTLISEDSWKYELLTALRSGCFFGISCFALISGYVGVQSRYRYSALAIQWLKVWVYSVLFTWLADVLFPGTVTSSQWDMAFYPAQRQQYWYFSAYVGCFMLAPVIRIAIRNMTFRQASFTAAGLLLVFSFLNSWQGGDPYFVNAGKNTLWLVVLYAIGAYFGQFKPHERIPMALLWLLAVCSMLLLAGMKPVGERLGFAIGAPRNDSPETILAAISMLLLFSRIRITRGGKLVSVLGAASFGVYLIHDHPLVRQHMISTYAYLLAGLGTATIVPGVILASMGVYLVCTAVDTLRQKLFDLLHIRQGFAEIEKKLIGDLWAD